MMTTLMPLRSHHRPSAARQRSPLPARLRHPAPSRPGEAARPSLPAPRIGLAPCAAAQRPHRAGALLVVAVVTFAVVCGLVLLGQAVAALREVPREVPVVHVGAGAIVRDIAERTAPGVSGLQALARGRSVDHNI